MSILSDRLRLMYQLFPERYIARVRPDAGPPVPSSTPPTSPDTFEFPQIYEQNWFSAHFSAAPAYELPVGEPEDMLHARFAEAAQPAAAAQFQLPGALNGNVDSRPPMSPRSFQGSNEIADAIDRARLDETPLEGIGGLEMQISEGVPEPVPQFGTGPFES